MWHYLGASKHTLILLRIFRGQDPPALRSTPLNVFDEAPKRCCLATHNAAATTAIDRRAISVRRMRVARKKDV